MKRVLFAATALALIWGTGVAKADIIPQTPLLVDLGATGFGNAPRLLTLQNNGIETGNVAAGSGGTALFFTGNATPGSGTSCSSDNTCANQPMTAVDKTNVFTVASLGWLTGQNVGIGLDTNEAGNVSGFTVDAINLTLFSSSGVALHTFSLAAPLNISAALLAAQQGNGNSVFNFGLNAAEETEFNAILAANGGATHVFEGLGAQLGCATPSSTCFASTDGADSFLAFAAVPGPVVGAGLPGLISAAFGLFGLNRWRRKRRVA